MKKGYYLKLALDGITGFSERPLTLAGWVGAAMVLGAMAASELLPSRE